MMLDHEPGREQLSINTPAESKGSGAPAAPRSAPGNSLRTGSATLLTNARVLIGHGEHALALNLLRQAVHQEPRNVLVLTVLADTLEVSAKLDEALKVRQVLARLSPSFESAYAWAQALYRCSRDEEALAQYYEALSMMETESPQLFEIQKNMGNIFVRRGDFESAEECYNKAYTMNPSSDVLLVNLGTLEIQRGDFERARLCFRRAVEKNPASDKAWIGLALVHNEFGDFDLAWGNLERALDLAPLNRTGVYMAAHWALRDRQPGRVLEVVQNFISESVEVDEEMSLALIHLFCAAGRVDCASFEVERVLAWNPGREDFRQLRKSIADSLKGAA